MSLLIQEPPLAVLRSLAMRYGLNQAIVLQQLHYRERDGWVDRGFDVWQKLDFPFWSERTVRRVFTDLVKVGLVERDGESMRFRITPAEHFKMLGQSVNGSGQSVLARGNKALREEEKTTPKKPSPRKILALADEPEGFENWLGHHVTIAGRLNLSLSVPKHGTSYRSSLARTFAALVEEGYTAEDFELASEGVLSDEYMRLNGHVKPENVLRKEKIGGRIQNGRLWREQRATGTNAKYGHLDG